jgi:hypothetical protein
VRTTLSEYAAGETEAIHHVDTTFGILLVIMVFESNLLLGFLQRSGSARGELLAVILACLVVGTILVGLVGILKQSWRERLLAWNATLALVLLEFASLLLGMIGIQFGIIITWGQFGILAAVLLLVSSLLTAYLVVEAYSCRLSAINPNGIQIAMLRHWKKISLLTGATGFGIILILALLSPP